LVILESTVAPGTTERMLKDRVKDYAFSPERINPGDPYFEVHNIPKVVGGSPLAREFYESLGIKVHYVAEPKVAELSKLVENTYRLVNIALAHQLKDLARVHGCKDYDAVVDAAATKPFGFMAFRPSVGVGGHCIPVDPVFLCHPEHHSSTLIGDALDTIHDIPAELAENLLSAFPDAFSFLLIGASYKPNVSDTRESPTFALQRVLESQGVKVCVWDDLCRLYPSPGARFDVAVRMQAHSCERTDLISAVAHTIVDGVNYV
jgi:UDP-N-acetyl-D-glucosamine dehydrogenase